jgi:hypothetical protein
MKTDDLENELRSLRFAHLTESELAAYDDQALDQMGRARVEAHLKQCFICERQLELLREESALLNPRVIPAEDVAFVERLMEQMGSPAKPSAASRPQNGEEVALRERLAEYLRAMVASWQTAFGQPAVRGVTEQAEVVWRWQSDDGLLRAWAMREKKADLTIHFSSSEMALDGARLNVRVGRVSQQTILRRVSESEVYTKVAVARRQQPRNLADISIESV